MRAYIPVSPAELAALLATGTLPAPRRAWAVDPAWRAGAPEVGEEEWEYEATTLAVAGIPGSDGLVLAVDTAAPAHFDDGAVTLAVDLTLRDVAAALTTDLSWYGVGELADLLGG